MTLDLDPLRREAAGRLGNVLLALGAKVRGSSDRGRSSCPLHPSDSLASSFGNGVVTCHSGCGGVSRDALSLVAEVDGLDLRRREDLEKAAEKLAAILGTSVEREASHGQGGAQYAAKCRGTSASAPHPDPPAPRLDLRPSRDVEALWRRLAPRDKAGEAYLAGRRLLPDPLLSGVLRFNVGTSGDPWLDDRARDGYRCSFAGRRVDGTVGTIVSRHSGPGAPSERFGKVPTLPRCSTVGVAIARPEVALLSTGDPEFERDEVAIVEGPTDWLGATIAFDLAYGNGRTPPVWTLGAIGTSNAVGVAAAFASIIRGRTLHVGLDTDPAGEKHVPAVVAAAWEAGASRVTRLAASGKDIAEAMKAIG